MSCLIIADKGAVMLTGQSSFDRARLIKQSETELY